MDISERKQAAEEFRASEHLARGPYVVFEIHCYEREL